MFDDYDYPINLVVALFDCYPDNWYIPKDLEDTANRILDKSIDSDLSSIDISVLMKRFVEKKDISIISSELGVSSESAKTRIRRALSKLSTDKMKTYLLLGYNESIKLFSQRRVYLEKNPCRMLLSEFDSSNTETTNKLNSLGVFIIEDVLKLNSKVLWNTCPHSYALELLSILYNNGYDVFRFIMHNYKTLDHKFYPHNIISKYVDPVRDNWTPTCSLNEDFIYLLHILNLNELKVFTLYYKSGYSIEEIAVMMKMSTDYISILLDCAINKVFTNYGVAVIKYGKSRADSVFNRVVVENSDVLIETLPIEVSISNLLRSKGILYISDIKRYSTVYMEYVFGIDKSIINKVLMAYKTCSERS